MIIGRHGTINNVNLNIYDERESILLLGGEIEQRYQYLDMLLKSLYPSPFHIVKVYDKTPGLFETLFDEVNYDVYSYDQLEEDFHDLIKEISEREKLFTHVDNYAKVRHNKEARGEPFLPELTYVFNNLSDYATPLFFKNAKPGVSHLFISKLFTMIKHLKDLGIRIVVSTKTLRYTSLDNNIASFMIRFYLGGCDEHEETLVLGEPYYLSERSGQVINSLNGGKPRVLSLPLSYSIPKWVKEVFESINTRQYSDFVFLSKYMCLSCFKPEITLSTVVCPDCGKETIFSIAVGKLVLDAINDSFIKGKLLTPSFDFEQETLNWVSKKVSNQKALKELFGQMQNNDEYTDEDFTKDFKKIFFFYHDQYKEVAKRKGRIENVFLKEFEIHDLFGNESFRVDFTSSELISILYGTNAFGKTTLLKMLSTLLSDVSTKDNVLNFVELKALPFKYSKITFSNGSYILVEKTKPSAHFGSLFIRYYFEDEVEDNKIVVGDYPPLMVEAIKSHFVYLHRLIGASNQIAFINANRFIDYDGLLREMSRRLLQKDSISFDDISYQKLKIMYKTYVHSSFLEKMRLNIFNHGTKITNLIKKAHAEMNNSPRFSKFRLPVPIAPERYEELNQLIRAGCFQGKMIEELQVHCGLETESHKELLKTEYFVEKYYEPINHLIASFYVHFVYFARFKEYFESFYEEYNPSRKTIWIEDGRIYIKTSNGERLPFEKLSTGENNIISILYSLIFNIRNNIIFLDEPEISLHVLWQMRLMEIITELVEMRKNLQVIIATHSVYIGAHHGDSLSKVEILYNDQ